MTSAWEKWKKNNVRRQETGVVRPWDFVNPETEYASEDAQQSRYSICENCPHLTVAKTCTQCGCFMPAKTRLKHAVCPIEKW
jgi:membrane protease subunit (stomatin/prohibitin family)